MNNKGFTLIEVLAVLVILSIIFISMVSLDVFKTVDNSKNMSFVTNARIIISKAEAMYNSERTMDNLGTLNNKIYLKDINGIDNISDPYDGTLDMDNSYVLFKDTEENNILVTKAYIYIKTCKDRLCHVIGSSSDPVYDADLNYKDVKEENNN